MKRLLECKLYRLKNISWHEDLHQFLDDIECDLEFKKEVDKKLSLSNRPDYRPAIESDGQAPQSTPFRLGHSKAFGLSRAIDTERFNLEESRREGDRVSEKNALSALALAFTQLQQTRKAIQFFQEQLEIVRELKDTEEECDVLANLGDALAISGNIDQAKSYYEEQLQIAESKEFRRFIASAQNGLGFVHVKQNKIGLAIECYLLALGIYRELDNQDKELELLVGIGLNYRKLEDHQRAIFHLEQALNVSKYVENRREESCILVDLTEANYQLGNFDRAHSLLIQAEEYLNKFEEAYLPSERKRLRVLRDSLIDK
jgi:tetratricopeptide (TPR) repeat protein